MVEYCYCNEIERLFVEFIIHIYFIYLTLKLTNSWCPLV